MANKKIVTLRQKKISEQIKRIIIQYLMLELLRDNPIKNMFLITKTQVSKDLKNANVYIKIENLDKRIRDFIKNTLNDLSSEIKLHLAKNMVLKFVPEVKFFLEVMELEFITNINTGPLNPEKIL